MAYQATIHTLTISVTPNENWRGNVWGWIDHIKTACPYARIPKYAGHGTYNVFINPHKESSEGQMYTFDYMGLSEYTEAMERICTNMNVDDYAIKRFDICIDSDRRYRETEKLTRLMLLMLGENIGASNRFTSTDPLNFDPKNTYISNSNDIKTRTLEAEHYNRSLLDQSQWTNAPIINRLELRSMGAQAGKKHDEKSIVENWIRRFEELDNTSLIYVCRRVNDALLDEWKEHSALRNKNSKTAFNDFLRNHYKSVYTREQLTEMFDVMGYEAEDSVKNLLKPRRSGNLFTLYSMSDVRREANEITAAMRDFVGR